MQRPKGKEEVGGGPPVFAAADPQTMSTPGPSTSRDPDYSVSPREAFKSLFRGRTKKMAKLVSKSARGEAGILSENRCSVGVRTSVQDGTVRGGVRLGGNDQPGG